MRESAALLWRAESDGAMTEATSEEFLIGSIDAPSSLGSAFSMTESALHGDFGLVP